MRTKQPAKRAQPPSPTDSWGPNSRPVTWKRMRLDDIRIARRRAGIVSDDEISDAPTPALEEASENAPDASETPQGSEESLSERSSDSTISVPESTEWVQRAERMLRQGNMGAIVERTGSMAKTDTSKANEVESSDAEDEAADEEESDGAESKDTEKDEDKSPNEDEDKKDLPKMNAEGETVAESSTTSQILDSGNVSEGAEPEASESAKSEAGESELPIS